LTPLFTISNPNEKRTFTFGMCVKSVATVHLGAPLHGWTTMAGSMYTCSSRPSAPIFAFSEQAHADTCADNCAATLGVARMHSTWCHLAMQPVQITRLFAGVTQYLW
jgi:hypothetical protein